MLLFAGTGPAAYQMLYPHLDCQDQERGTGQGKRLTFLPLAPLSPNVVSITGKEEAGNRREEGEDEKQVEKRKVWHRSQLSCLRSELRWGDGRRAVRTAGLGFVWSSSKHHAA